MRGDPLRSELQVVSHMSEDKQNKDKQAGRELFPVLPLRDIVVFPYMIVPLFVGREKSINALEEVMRADKHILLAAQKNAGDDDPATDAIYEMGTLASVLAAFEAARRHREGAGRRQRARQDLRYTDNAELLRSRKWSASPSTLGAKG